MPVIIGSDQPSVQKEGRTRDRYEILALSDSQKKESIYRKLESSNPEICDTSHDPNYPWVEQFTDLPQVLKRLGIKPRIEVGSEMNSRPISDDDGYILTFHGKFERECAFVDKRILRTEEADEMIELGQIDDYDRYNLWVFRLHEVIKTNGPELTRQKQELEEVQKQRSEDRLLGTIEKAFAGIAGKFSGKSEDLPDGAAGLVQMLSQMDEEERADLFAQAEIESDIIKDVTVGSGESDK